MSKKTWIIFVVICVAILGALVFISRQGQVNVSSIDQTKVVAASAANGNIGDHVYGAKDGKAILIEYGDFQCPACGSAYPNLKEVKEEFKDSLTFIFRNNPLTSIHPNARAGAAAAEAAGLQGKFWEMHNVLYEKQTEWGDAPSDRRVSFFEAFAREAGVKDIEKFKADLENKSVSDKINFDLALGRKDGVTATPTLLLDGKKIEGDTWGDKAKLKKAVEDAIK